MGIPTTGWKQVYIRAFRAGNLPELGFVLGVLVVIAATLSVLGRFAAPKRTEGRNFRSL